MVTADDDKIIMTGLTGGGFKVAYIYGENEERTEGVHPIGERTAMLHRNLREREGGKNTRLADKYTKFGQLIVRKIITILPPGTRCHILWLKCTKFDSGFAPEPVAGFKGFYV